MRHLGFGLVAIMFSMFAAGSAKADDIDHRVTYEMVRQIVHNQRLMSENMMRPAPQHRPTQPVYYQPPRQVSYQPQGNYQPRTQFVNYQPDYEPEQYEPQYVQPQGQVITIRIVVVRE